LNERRRKGEEIETYYYVTIRFQRQLTICTRNLIQAYYVESKRIPAQVDGLTQTTHKEQEASRGRTHTAYLAMRVIETREEIRIF
jgi:hypothetical protein